MELTELVKQQQTQITSLDAMLQKKDDEIYQLQNERINEHTEVQKKYTNTIKQLCTLQSSQLKDSVRSLTLTQLHPDEKAVIKQCKQYI